MKLNIHTSCDPEVPVIETNPGDTLIHVTRRGGKPWSQGGSSLSSEKEGTISPHNTDESQKQSTECQRILFQGILKPRKTDSVWIYMSACVIAGFPDGTSGKEPTCQCRRGKRHGFNPWVGKIPWRKTWQPTSVFLLEESHGQRSLVGCGPWGRSVGHD